MEENNDINEFLLPHLSDEMRCFTLTNSIGDVFIVHEKELEVDWVEFDTMNNSFSLIHPCGEIQELGIKIDKKMIANILSAQEVVLSCAKNGRLTNIKKCPLILRDY